MLGSGMTALIISNKELGDVMKKVKFYWWKVLMKQLKSKQNNIKVDFLVCY